MRRSKSDPAKYARGYKKISKRRMTGPGNDDNFDESSALNAPGAEEKEMERLRQIMRTSRAHLDRAAAVRNGTSLEEQDDDDDNVADNLDGTKKKKRKRSKKDNDRDGGGDGVGTSSTGAPIQDDAEDGAKDSIFSPEMQAEMDAIGAGCDDCVILPTKKKKKKATKVVELTSEEIKAARSQHKNAARKLKQLADRKEQKKKRAELYATLRENAISSEERELLASSSTLGKRVSKREQLQRLIRRERAGIQLTEEEKNVLYTERKVGGDDNSDGDIDNDSMNGNASSGRIEEKVAGKFESKNVDTSATLSEKDDSGDDAKAARQKQKKERRKKRKLKQREQTAQSEEEEKCQSATNKAAADEADKDEEGGESIAMDISHENGRTSSKADAEQPEIITPFPKETSPPPVFNPASFAASMMADLSSLKTTTAADTEVLRRKEAAEAKAAEAESLRLEEEERKKRKVYVPSESVVVKTAATLGLLSKAGKSNWRVLPVDRPEEIDKSRFDLPVSAMEFEIVDSVRSSDTTIICAETGSGKSTQVVQMLYEAGISLGNASSLSEDEGLLIGVTQPRRVAAVSTAKRVCYEMGHSRDKGQSIRGKKGEGNLVAYQTRYESAGLGSKTRVKFMTDGILLSEIQNDLLLRKYGAVILDEAHERNLNTDVLLGLLSTAIPLRRKASEEGTMPPLKLIIMSATLRVEDFAGNPRLFPNAQPNLVRIPGRTHPVTIHHSKVTELDDFVEATFKKVIKIHRKLPVGGILVFLTGKAEIIRMVNRLRKALAPRRSQNRRAVGDADVSTSAKGNEMGEVVNIRNLDDAGALRDMDDDEVDGDLFADGDRDDYEDQLSDSADEDEDEDMGKAQAGGDDGDGNEEDSNRPNNVLILPLYSLLSAQEQAKVFKPVPEGTRLIVCATNIAETSLTIPGISFVVDTGRQKCRNYHAGTGVTSYDVMWISKAAADQRAGRAGRTSEGHCYRLYSSSLYSRHMDPFALPEVLTRPLEDVALAMKAMKVTNVGSFPFPTAPDQGQTNAAIRRLARIGCVDVSRTEETGGDGKITRLGAAIAKLPLGVRYGKMLLVAAQANVLDYGIILVAVLSESSPFINDSDVKTVTATDGDDNDDDDEDDDLKGFDEVDRNNIIKEERKKRKEKKKRKWSHKGGDILASVLAVGAYTYAGRGAGGAAEVAACKHFCEENGLNYVVMERIQKMRRHLAKLATTRLGSAEGVAATTGGILVSMPPPNKLQENLLAQTIAAGLLDNIARRSPPGAILDDGPRTRYFSCSSKMTEPLFIDQSSVLYSRDSRQLPEWVCYDTSERKSTKDGSTIMVMKNVTPVDPEWLGALADGSNLLSMGVPLDTPLPSYNKERDAVMCSVTTKFGDHGWLIPSRQVVMYDAVNGPGAQGSAFLADDSFRWFARFLLEGKVLKELQGLAAMLNDDPAIISRRKPVQKVALLVSSLASAGIDSAAALQKHWAEKDSKFLFKHMKSWTKKDRADEVKHMWVQSVKANVQKWRAGRQ